MKRIFASCFIIIIISMTFIIGYTKSDSLVYADSTTDSWLDVTTNQQLADAFRYYCKSRDLTIEGSAADALTSFTTKTFNGLCNTLGIDITALQAQIKYQTDGNTGTRFLFSALGIDAYNRIFAQFLQDNDLEVGDEVNDDVLYSGEYYTDPYTHQTCLVYVTDGVDANTNIRYSGTTYMYTFEDMLAFLGNSATYQTSGFHRTPTNKTLTLVIEKYTQLNFVRLYVNNSGGYYYEHVGDLSNGSITRTYKGSLIVYRLTNDNTNKKYFGFLNENYYSKPRIRKAYDEAISTNYNSNFQTVNITITTNNNTINNNTYEGDTVINNEGDVINNDNDTTINYNPYPDGGGTTSNPNNTGGGSGEDDSVITFPNFDFHFPEIDWSLGDLSEKFPFSIPFDLIAFFTVLNAEPQAPAINADIPLGTWYTWHFEADFSQFDNWAAIIRNVEFIGFCVGLIYLTIRLVKG